MTQFNLDTPIVATTKTGTQLASDLSNWRDAVNTIHMATSQPSYRVSGQLWWDNTSATLRVLKAYDGTDWSNMFIHDATNNLAWAATQNPRFNFPLTGGATNAQTLTLSPALTAYVDGDVFTFEASITSTGAFTLNVNGVGAKAVRKMVGGTDIALIANDIVAGVRYKVNYDSAANAAAGAFILIIDNPHIVHESDRMHIGKATTALATAGYSFLTSGQAQFTAADAGTITANRTGSSGAIINIALASTVEGTISATGVTVSYNAFLGSHWSQTADGSKPELLKGTVVETLDAFNTYDGEDHERLPRFKVSDTPTSKRVYGVFLDWDNDDNYGDALIAALGAGWVRIAEGVTVDGGDLLESAGGGCATVQEDDIVRSSTIGKVSSPTPIETYDDGSYLVAAVLMCG